MNIPNAIVVKKRFLDAFIATPTKYFSLVLSFNTNTPDSNTATLAALQAYSNSIRESDVELATRIDELVVDMQAQ